MSKQSEIEANAKKVHPLADKTSPFIRIEFIHSDNQPHVFYSCVNRLSNQRLMAWDNAPLSIEDSLAPTKKIIKNILANAVKVNEIIRYKL